VNEAYLIRTLHLNTCTLGRLFIDGHEFKTLEPPWSNNRKNKSCIKDGEYTVRFMPRSASGKYKNVYHLQRVDGRSGILIHNGNKAAHTLGCILVGTRHGRLGGERAVLSSRVAMRKLNRITGKGDFKLWIY
jgi:hypothetical protein